MNYGWIIITVLLLQYGNASYAQQSDYTISGSVIDAEHHHVVAANVLILTEQNVLLKAGVTDVNGAFSLDEIAKGTYTLKVMLSGVETYSYNLAVSTNAEIPTIILLQKSSAMQEV